MSRDFYINGESLIRVRSRSDSAIGTIQELGLTEGPIRISPTYRHKDINVDAWGGEIPAEVQFMLAECTISLSLIHFDVSILATCQALSKGFLPTANPLTQDGTFARAGQRLGNNTARFLPGNNYIGLNITSPVSAYPWRFLNTYITNPLDWPLGTEKSVLTVNFRCIPYTQDPYGGGTGAYGYILWDHLTDD